MATAGVSIVQPDVTLHLDPAGVIRRADLSVALGENATGPWIGQPWVSTLEDAGNDNVRRMLEDATNRGVSDFIQVKQRFPSGTELPIEYAAVCMADREGFIAIGKSLKAVAELKSQLINAQQAIERDYWRIRESETRYRLLFDSSNNAVLMTRVSDLRIQDANPVAIRSMGIAPVGRELLELVDGADRDSLRRMLGNVHEHGKAPAIIVHFGEERRPWMVRASLVTSDEGPLYFLQMSTAAPAERTSGQQVVPVDELLDTAPIGFVVLDENGDIRRANQAFMDIAQMASPALIEGQPLGRWLGQPGADTRVLLAHLNEHGSVHRFSSTLRGELGVETNVEVSASRSRSQPYWIGAFFKDAGPYDHERPLVAEEQVGAVALHKRLGTSSLREMVDEVVGSIEQRCIRAALDLTEGNRTAAAELLGLSRQSLYAKLQRYGIDSLSKVGA